MLQVGSNRFLKKHFISHLQAQIRISINDKHSGFDNGFNSLKTVVYQILYLVTSASLKTFISFFMYEGRGRSGINQDPSNITATDNHKLINQEEEIYRH